MTVGPDSAGFGGPVGVAAARGGGAVVGARADVHRLARRADAQA